MKYSVYIVEIKLRNRICHKIGYSGNFQKRCRTYGKDTKVITEIKCGNKFVALILEYALIDLLSEHALPEFREWFLIPEKILEELSRDPHEWTLRPPSHFFTRGTVKRSRHQRGRWK